MFTVELRRRPGDGTASSTRDGNDDQAEGVLKVAAQRPPLGGVGPKQLRKSSSMVAVVRATTGSGSHGLLCAVCGTNAFGPARDVRVLQDRIREHGDCRVAGLVLSVERCETAIGACLWLYYSSLCCQKTQWKPLQKIPIKTNTRLLWSFSLSVSGGIASMKPPVTYRRPVSLIKSQNGIRKRIETCV